MKLDLARPFHNWSLQLLALFIGASLWYGLAAEDQVDMVLSVPLELRNLSPAMVVANQYQKELEVSVHGPKRLLQELQQQNISRPVNLADAQPGPFGVRNAPDSFSFPRSVRVQRVQPANVTLMLDKLVARRIPLTARTTGIPAFGFSLEGVTLNPDSIEVSGPQSLLDSVQSIATAGIDVEGLTGNAIVKVPLDLTESLQKLVGETVVTAEIGIREPMTRRTVRQVPVRTGDGVRAEPAVVGVVADIPTAVIQNTKDLATLFQAEASRSEADGEGLAPVRVTPAKLTGHTPIALFSVRPEQVKLARADGATEPHPEGVQP